MRRPSIAVLGGGLTGLSCAFHLSRRCPEALITVLEKSPRFGGWVYSERVDVTHPEGGSAQILLESGPRTLRPNSKAVLELINLLGLKETLVITPKTSPAAKNRFLQLPEVQSNGLVPLPTSILSLLFSPLRDHLLWNVLREPMKRRNRPAGIKDESFDEFMARRFGSSFARKFGSALVHGIYAADSRRLSVRAAFPFLWEAEERGWGSVVRGFLVPNTQRSCSIDNDYELGDVGSSMAKASVFSFKDGMSTITDALVAYLKQRPNVRLLTNTGAETLGVTEGAIQVKTTAGDVIQPDFVASTLPLYELSLILHPSASLPHLTVNPYSSVTVFNFIFSLSQDQTPIHPAGFGYLIPRPVSGYSAESPGILGTVFDSCALSAQDMPEEARSRFTKLTVMAGGPYHIAQQRTSVDSVLRHLATHLDKSESPLPVLARSRHHNACIPTPTPGHLERMENLRGALMTGPWQGRLEVVGAGVRGVSLGDCIESGKRVGNHWRSILGLS
ncbi:Protoporphyrinogen oxidase [Marasmius fiardii PR-910]|nr:Protoporphyrinogen oxidase [Marasmius fiardii PR-910]